MEAIRKEQENGENQEDVEDDDDESQEDEDEDEEDEDEDGEEGDPPGWPSSPAATMQELERDVRTLLGPGHQAVTVERQQQRVTESSVVMVNGKPICLDGEEGARIKECLSTGVMPSQDLINHLLASAGLVLRPAGGADGQSPPPSGAAAVQKTRRLVKAEMQVSNVTTISKTVTCSSSASAEAAASSRFPGPSKPPPPPEPGGGGRARTAGRERGSPPHLDFSEAIRPDRPTFENLLSEMLLSTTTTTTTTTGEREGESPGEGGGGGQKAQHFSFLLWSRRFVSPNQLLDLLRSLLLLEEPQPEHAFVQETAAAASTVGRRRGGDGREATINTFVTRWIKWFPEDFSNDADMEKLKDVLILLQQQQHSRQPGSGSRSKTVAESSPHLVSTLCAHLAVMAKHRKQRQGGTDGARPPPASHPPTVSSRSSHCDCGGDLLLFSSVEVAQELTRIELEEFLAFLGPAQIINSLHKKEVDSSQSAPSPSLDTSEVDAYTEWFNHLSYMVASSVCKAKKRKRRVSLVRHWIEVARQCINLGNFNCLMAIITGLNMFPVSRLTKTWSSVHSSKMSGAWSVLGHQMDPSSNFASYRSTLTAAVARSQLATSQETKVIIPFFSLFYKDLFLTMERYRDRSRMTRQQQQQQEPSSWSWFDAREASCLSASVMDFTERKDVNCPYPKHQRLCSCLLCRHPACVLRSDDQLDWLSFSCEVPKNASERRRCKTLRKQQHESDEATAETAAKDT